jgi:hypothetical protein
MQNTMEHRSALLCQQCGDQLEKVLDLGAIAYLWCRRCRVRYAPLPGVSLARGVRACECQVRGTKMPPRLRAVTSRRRG